MTYDILAIYTLAIDNGSYKITKRAKKTTNFQQSPSGKGESMFVMGNEEREKKLLINFMSIVF